MIGPSIRVQHLSKRFSRSLKRAMLYGMQDLARIAWVPRRFRSDGLEARLNDAVREAVPVPVQEPDDGLRPGEFWALRDVSFEVAKGECVGIIGHNGAGKSTLFSILSGIYGPTAGHVEIRGRLQALIALGAGFHPMLSGRENIYINAAILGMQGPQIEAIMDEVIAFSELGDFIDMPVKNYSSGMMVRLGFSVAVHMKPDILLLDEVLAVGDLAFQNKSFDKMRDMIRSGITVVFVSHSIRAVEVICSRALWFDHGHIHMQGETDEVISAYVKSMDVAPAKGSGASRDAALFPIAITRVECVGSDGVAVDDFRWKQPVCVRLSYECRERVSHPYFYVAIGRPGREHAAFFRCHMMEDGLAWDFEPGSGVLECRLPQIPLAPGQYEVRCGIARTPTAAAGQKFYQEEFIGALFSVGASPAEMGRPGLLRAVSIHIPPLVVDHEWRKLSA